LPRIDADERVIEARLASSEADTDAVKARFSPQNRGDAEEECGSGRLRNLHQGGWARILEGAVGF
jgi:hypothetical protein